MAAKRDEIMTIDEPAESPRISRSTPCKQAVENTLPGTKIGKRWRLPPARRCRALRWLMPVTVAIAVAACDHPAANPGPAPAASPPLFAFAVMGRCRSGEARDQAGVTPTAQGYLDNVDRINADPRIELTVHCGDVIEGLIDDPAILAREWDNWDAGMRRLRHPGHVAPGNHDVWSDVSAGVFLQRYGPLYRSFIHRNCQFILLCADVPGWKDFIDDTQLAWLEKELAAAAGVRHRFVFLHQTPWTDAVRAYPEDARRSWMERVHPLLVRHRVTMVFGANEAGYLHQQIDGVRYVITGGGGCFFYVPREQGGFTHFVRVTVPPDGPPTISVVAQEREYPGDTERFPDGRTAVPVGIRGMANAGPIVPAGRTPSRPENRPGSEGGL